MSTSSTKKILPTLAVIVGLLVAGCSPSASKQPPPQAKTLKPSKQPSGEDAQLAKKGSEESTAETDLKYKQPYGSGDFLVVEMTSDRGRTILLRVKDKISGIIQQDEVDDNYLTRSIHLNCSDHLSATYGDEDKDGHAEMLIINKTPTSDSVKIYYLDTEGNATLASQGVHDLMNESLGIITELFDKKSPKTRTDQDREQTFDKAVRGVKQIDSEFKALVAKEAPHRKGKPVEEEREESFADIDRRISAKPGFDVPYRSGDFWIMEFSPESMRKLMLMQGDRYVGMIQQERVDSDYVTSAVSLSLPGRFSAIHSDEDGDGHAEYLEIFHTPESDSAQVYNIDKDGNITLASQEAHDAADGVSEVFTELFQEKLPNAKTIKELEKAIEETHAKVKELQERRFNKRSTSE